MVVNNRFGKKCWIALAAFGALLPLIGDVVKSDDSKSATNASSQPAKVKPSKEEVFSQENIAKLSETYGHLIYKSLESPVIKLDFDSVIRGMQAARSGKTAPMNEQQYEEAVSLVQEYAFQEMSQKNLKQAEEFLAKNSKESGVVELQPGKLQYMIVQNGKSDAEVVTDAMMPYILYKGSYLDGSVFGSTEESGEPVPIMLTQTIPGFRQAVLGMKVGEKRKIFIHPDLGYGTSGQLTPNAMLIFEVEVTKVEPAPAKASVEDSSDSDDDVSDASDSDDDDDEEQTIGSNASKSQNKDQKSSAQLLADDSDDDDDEEDDTDVVVVEDSDEDESDANL